LEVFKPSALDGVTFSRQLYIDSLTWSMRATLAGAKTIADTRAELLKKLVSKVREAMGSLRQDESKLRHERPHTGFKNPEATRTLWEGGYLFRQDIGTIGTDAYLQVLDRLKDVIKTGGEWVSSVDLESIIGEHPGVEEVAVIGLPDPKWGERPVAVVVPRVGAALDYTDINDQVMRQVGLGVVSQVCRTVVGVFSRTNFRRRVSAPDPLRHDHTAHRAPARNVRRQRVRARKSGAILYANRLALIACRQFRSRSSFS
jgi:acyl-CoA synthetase (AMP-forming)/AMP-acid ligase II